MLARLKTIEFGEWTAFIIASPILLAAVVAALPLVVVLKVHETLQGLLGGDEV